MLLHFFKTSEIANFLPLDSHFWRKILDFIIYSNNLLYSMHFWLTLILFRSELYSFD